VVATAPAPTGWSCRTGLTDLLLLLLLRAHHLLLLVLLMLRATACDAAPGV
jgi:hypothetical protein